MKLSLVGEFPDGMMMTKTTRARICRVSGDFSLTSRDFLVRLDFRMCEIASPISIWTMCSAGGDADDTS
jgi:hypothetical protein